MKAIILLGALALCLSAYSCTQLEADLCTGGASLQVSPVKLNTAQQTALTGLMNACSVTANGTQINSTTLAQAIIDNALLLQQSGLLSNVSIQAQAPEGQRVLERIKLRWERLGLK